jgi:hypothetical protein
MVHNGIEYGDMQLICEAYHIMKEGLGLTCDEQSAIFEKWNKAELDSFLIEITRDILKYKDTDGSPLVEKIRDTAGQVTFIALKSYACQLITWELERNWQMDVHLCLGRRRPSHADCRGCVLQVLVCAEG